MQNKDMPYTLDNTDIIILKSLVKDGRKSFRQISREVKISTPTVKARYQRLVNIGLIKGVFPAFDFTKIQNKTKRIESIKQMKNLDLKIDENIMIKLNCEYCKGLVSGKPTILRFADQERFFCCSSCRSLYKEKHGNRIRIISGSART